MSLNIFTGLAIFCYVCYMSTISVIDFATIGTCARWHGIAVFYPKGVMGCYKWVSNNTIQQIDCKSDLTPCTTVVGVFYNALVLVFFVYMCGLTIIEISSWQQRTIQCFYLTMQHCKNVIKCCKNAIQFWKLTIQRYIQINQMSRVKMFKYGKLFFLLILICNVLFFPVLCVINSSGTVRCWQSFFIFEYLIYGVKRYRTCITKKYTAYFYLFYEFCALVFLISVIINNVMRYKNTIRHVYLKSKRFCMTLLRRTSQIFRRTHDSAVRQPEAGDGWHMHVNDVCCICLEDMTENDAIIKFFKCKHLMHHECHHKMMSFWDRLPIVCPSCKFPQGDRSATFDQQRVGEVDIFTVVVELMRGMIVEPVD